MAGETETSSYLLLMAAECMQIATQKMQNMCPLRWS